MSGKCVSIVLPDPMDTHHSKTRDDKCYISTQREHLGFTGLKRFGLSAITLLTIGINSCWDGDKKLEKLGLPHSMMKPTSVFFVEASFLEITMAGPQCAVGASRTRHYRKSR